MLLLRMILLKKKQKIINILSEFNGAHNQENSMERIKPASLMTAIKTPYRPDGEVDL